MKFRFNGHSASPRKRHWLKISQSSSELGEAAQLQLLQLQVLF
ncbi:hypothetical protein JCM19236_6323 [Vibrio sp. JCM 19236]|nr:hypothetical protein JCM19236_6323 [Vibrio sp. JCM 19236]